MINVYFNNGLSGMNRRQDNDSNLCALQGIEARPYYILFSFKSSKSLKRS